MSRPRGFYVVGLLAIGLVSGAAMIWRARHPHEGDAGRIESSRPQCAHWCVLRCCELLGAPVDMNAVLELFPARPGGRSFLEVTDALRRVGFDVEGRRETPEATAKGDLPCIVHLRDPDHFIVLFSTEGNRFHVFDNGGERKTFSAETLSERWTGNVLHVRRRADSGPFPKYLNRLASPGPCIQFQRLYLDVGRVKSGDGVIAFPFPFQNMGNAPLVVEGVKTSCACTGSTRPETPVPPGGSGSIELLFRAEAVGGGSFSQNAIVRTNDPHFPVVMLRIGGAYNQGVYIIPRRLDLGEIALGESKSALLFVRSNADAADVTVEQVASLHGIAAAERCKPTDDLLRKESRELKRADCGGPECRNSLVCIVRVTVSSQGRDLGPFDDLISVFTNIAEAKPMVVPIQGSFVPPVTLSPTVLDFGQVEPDTEYHQRVAIVPKLRVGYRIDDVQTDRPGMAWSFSRSVSTGQSTIDLAATGNTLVAASGSTVGVRVVLEGSGRELVLPLSICAWIASTDREEQAPKLE